MAELWNLRPREQLRMATHVRRRMRSLTELSASAIVSSNEDLHRLLDKCPSQIRLMIVKSVCRSSVIVEIPTAYTKELVGGLAGVCKLLARLFVVSDSRRTHDGIAEGLCLKGSPSLNQRFSVPVTSKPQTRLEMRLNFVAVVMSHARQYGNPFDNDPGLVVALNNVCARQRYRMSNVVEESVSCLLRCAYNDPSPSSTVKCVVVCDHCNYGHHPSTMVLVGGAQALCLVCSEFSCGPKNTRSAACFQNKPLKRQKHVH